MIDSSAWIELFYGNERIVSLLEKLVENRELCITPTIYSEVSFVLLGHNFTLKTGRKGTYTLKKELKKNPKLYDIVEKFDEMLDSLESLGILEFLEENEEVIKLSREHRKQYSLLPNDAIITAACDYYGIKDIVTLDKDFLRTDLNILR